VIYLRFEGLCNYIPAKKVQLNQSVFRKLNSGHNTIHNQRNVGGTTMSLIIEKDGPVTTVVINRPERRNAINEETAAELLAAFEAFEKDEASSVAVLAGAGGCFCAGWDLKEFAEVGFPEEYDPEGDGALGVSRRLLSKPVIAAVDGHAVAGGLELALWCDMRIMETDAIFGVFCRRWGVPLIDGGTVRLPRLIGASRALDMILTGRSVGADEALAWGLANRVVAHGRALEEAQSLAAEIARFPQICMRADRMSCHRQWDLDLTEALRNEGIEGDRPLREEARRGAGRFAEGLGRRGSFKKI
jgi:enoyl-CoA hydratase